MIDTESHKVSQDHTKVVSNMGYPWRKGRLLSYSVHMKDLKIGAACMKAGSGTVGGGSFCLSTCNTVRSIDFVTFQSHLKFGSDDSISENQFE